MKNIETFKIGDLVKVTCSTTEHDGKVGKVIRMNSGGVGEVELEDECCNPDSVVHYTKALADAQKGDVLVLEPSGNTCKVFANLEGLLFLSVNDDYATYDEEGPYTASGLEDMGWTIKGEEPEEDTIEIEGKKYTVSEIKKALKV